MKTSWYVGERITTFCTRCSEKMKTTIINPNGIHKNQYCQKCKREMKR